MLTASTVRAIALTTWRNEPEDSQLNITIDFKELIRGRVDSTAQDRVQWLTDDPV